VVHENGCGSNEDRTWNHSGCFLRLRYKMGLVQWWQWKSRAVKVT
jgi:hypothetical protein